MCYTEYASYCTSIVYSNVHTGHVQQCTHWTSCTANVHTGHAFISSPPMKTRALHQMWWHPTQQTLDRKMLRKSWELWKDIASRQMFIQQNHTISTYSFTNNSKNLTYILKYLNMGLQNEAWCLKCISKKNHLNCVHISQNFHIYLLQIWSWNNFRKTSRHSAYTCSCEAECVSWKKRSAWGLQHHQNLSSKRNPHQGLRSSWTTARFFP